MNKIAIITISIALTGCVQTPNGLRSDLSDEQAFALAKKRVIEELKDPYSAHFGEQMFRKTKSLGFDFDRICGTVNAKNSFGAYTGMKVWSYNLVNDRVVMGDNAVMNCAVS